MKLLYICECCDAIVNETGLLSRPFTGEACSLTGEEQADIIKIGDQDVVVIKTLCGDCRETLYGGPDSALYNWTAPH